ncbi:Zinc-binding dehydrogenase [Saccharopolyspora shandongensis]|uniref:Zinc-binding dehydrogenase n=1 Tax=Saccharopolyspora shandongensis TaxID=418495 RepID=A0A1H2XYD6_9PSEU|nr:zinc-binding dehydrogenase [Saccharopolyspora shandongensis]SDW97972.1 Zinc-binding dehydrogenase [Saccharopolyspora shandongensis]
MSGQAPSIPMAEMCRAEALFRPFSLFNYMARAEDRLEGISFVQQAVAKGLRPKIDSVFEFADLMAAYRQLESNRSAGKIVVKA